MSNVTSVRHNSAEELHKSEQEVKYVFTVSQRKEFEQKRRWFAMSRSGTTEVGPQFIAQWWPGVFFMLSRLTG